MFFVNIFCSVNAALLASLLFSSSTIMLNMTELSDQKWTPQPWWPDPIATLFQQHRTCGRYPSFFQWRMSLFKRCMSCNRHSSLFRRCRSCGRHLTPVTAVHIRRLPPVPVQLLPVPVPKAHGGIKNEKLLVIKRQGKILTGTINKVTK